jgi:hypothetical protein
MEKGVQRTFCHWIVILFCLWHMTAIAVYCIPDESKNYYARAIADTGVRLAEPYLLLTSQWQKWNIFAPDPIRGVYTYRVEELHGDTWTPVLTIDPKHLPWWKRAKTLKLMNNIQDNADAGGAMLLGYLCRRGVVRHGVPVRLQSDWYLLPTNNELRAIGGWSFFQPSMQAWTIYAMTCPLSL